MCFGGGGAKDTELAKQAAAQEQARQDRIKEGMRQIDRMFGGGQYGTGWVAPGTAYDPSKTYYNHDLQQWTPPGQADIARTVQQSGFDNFSQGTPMLDQQQALQKIFESEAGGAGMYTGVATTPGYNEDFYNKAYQAQLDYALPQVDRQFQDAQRELQYGLARQGLGQSTQAGQQMAKLEGERQLAVQEVAPYFQNATGALADMIVSPSMRMAASGRSGSYGYGAGKGSGRVVGG